MPRRPPGRPRGSAAVPKPRSAPETPEETTYTAGPWLVFGNEVVSADGRLVALTNTASRPHPEERANAQLIAATPDLLKAMKDWLRYETDDVWRDEKDREADRATAGNVGYAEVLMAAMEDAVAKAEGRTAP